MAGSAAANLLRDGWETSSHIAHVVLLLGVGGALALPAAWWIATVFVGRKRWEARIAAALIFLPLTTICMTAGVYVFVYQKVFVAGPADVLPSTLSDIVLGMALSFAMFAATSLRLYFPIGFIALPFAALWFARHPR